MTSVPSGQSSPPQNAMTDEHEDAGSPAQNSPSFPDDQVGMTSAEADREAATGEDVDTQYEPETDSAAADEDRLQRGAE